MNCKSYKVTRLTCFISFGNSAGLNKILTELFRQVQSKLKHSCAKIMGHYVDADLYMAFFLIFLPEKEAKKVTIALLTKLPKIDQKRILNLSQANAENCLANYAKCIELLEYTEMDDATITVIDTYFSK